MKKIYTKLLIAALTLCTSVGFAQSDLILTGILDGPLSGGTPKALEIYVVNDIADLSAYGIANVNNGGDSPGAPSFTFPNIAVTGGSYLYVSTDSANFNTYFGIYPNFVSGSVSVNGDDAMELYQDGTVVDYFGEVGVDGTGTAWEYKDGWAYRNNGTGPNTTFTTSEWTFSGVDATDGNSTNAEAANPWPLGTYSTEGGGGGDPVDATIQEIQETTDPSGDSPMDGQLVGTNGIVTAVSDVGFWIQDGTGAWSGIFVEQEATAAVRGDDVDVIGTVEELHDVTQISGVTDVVVNSSGNALPATTTLTTGAAGVEDYESVLINLMGVTCTNNDLGYGEWAIDDGSGAYRVDDEMYDASPVTFMGYDLTGIATYSFSDWKLFPRDANDVVENAGADVLGLSFENDAMDVDESTGTVTVNVDITNPAATETTVDVVVSGGTAVNGTNYTFTDPTTLTFPANSTDSQSFTFEVINDSEPNEDRTITFQLQNATNAAVFGNETTDVTIADDDGEVVITDIAVVAAVDADGVAIHDGEEYTIAGIVYGVNMNAGGLSFTVIDQTGGIGIYNSDPLDDYTVIEGDSVVITGLVDQYAGLTQMNPTSITLVSSGNELMDPIVTTELNENLESHLVKLECVYIVDPSEWSGEGSGFNVTVSNGTDEFDIRIDNDVDLYAAEPPTGTFNLIGIVGQHTFDTPLLNGYQVFPRYTADIETADCNVDLPPENDQCNAAFNITDLTGGPLDEMQTSTGYTNLNATTGDEPGAGYDCFEDDGLENTVWFTFTGDGNTYTIQTTDCNGTAENYIPNGDTQMAVYAGGCGLASPVACNEDMDYENDIYEAGVQVETEAGQTYLVMVDGYNGAQGDFCIGMTYINPDGISRINNFDFEVYPNPSSDRFYVEAPKSVDAAVLTNVIGQQVRRFTFNPSQRVELDVKGLDAGIYLLELRSGDQVSTTKVVVE